MKINGNTIEFTKEKPNKEGKFLWKNSLGIEVLTVRMTATVFHGGVSYDPQVSYICVSGAKPLCE